jgi:CRISPR-associated endonuclease/helicase Cas3
MDILCELQERGLDLSKETHPAKSYYIHVKECCEFINILMDNVYNYPKDLVRFALLFSELHDVGKLLPEWSLNLEKRPYHAIEGAEWLLREDIKLPISPPYREILIYAIMMHHSMLYVPLKVRDIIEKSEKIKPRHFDKYSKCKVLINTLNDTVRKLKRDVRFDLADAIGIAKLADIISAKGLPSYEVLLQYRWPEGLEASLIREISKRACEKRGMFDKSRFEKQVEVASCGERHLLVAAPTGWGKTALALVRMTKIKPVKIFYILPTITAIKDFYDMFTKIINESYVGEYFYFADVELLRRRESEDDLIDIYRCFIPKITLTTIDQLLLTILQVGRYHIRRFNLRDSLLVFDEFHLLTPQMIACLRIFLKNLLEHYNASCLFMSATPSPVYEELIKESIPQLKSMILSDEYGRLRRHKIDYCSDEIVEDFIVRKQDLLRKERTLIIVNTVGRAQKIYLDLKRDLGGSRKIMLVHGDFAYKDRRERENQINNAEILVSTQVAEVSLDISFDLLITELSPIPSLVQRFGRVNRYGAEPDKTNVFICKPEDDKPYGLISMNLAYKNLPMLLEGLERVGEKAYLSDEFWRYEEIYKRDVEGMEQEILDMIDNTMLDFFSFKISERDFSKMLGREETYLAVPDIYLEEVFNLYEKLKRARDYRERKEIYTSIKEYLAPASRSDFNRMEFREELGLYVIRGYDREMGIKRL